MNLPTPPAVRQRPASALMPPTSHLQSNDAATTPPRTPEPKRTPGPKQTLLLQRVGSPGSLRALLRADAAARGRALGPDNAVEAPAGCEEDLWIDIHVVEAFNDLHALWEQVGLDEKCREKCGENPPTAGDRTYAWDADSDDDDTIVAWDLPAADYVARTFESFARASRDRAVFPEPDGGAFPAGFRPGARKACGRLLRCWMHLCRPALKPTVSVGQRDRSMCTQVPQPLLGRGGGGPRGRGERVLQALPDDRAALRTRR